ncbi:hypothetical protein J2Y38_003263 [Flavobacterium sp. 2755]|jgi:hypothetical protein|uniref:hypothetical protein n=1 Tax=Flavobacterium sp. 2755 TaxID=2817765 RepID=UPI00285745D9|nr:hypothetical protein [Flavobacterium sp. 2755]MDR6763045.1 hypothetical protein [Flavobacterium sp. 2755]
MKNITLILFLILGLATGCSSDEDDKAGVNSSIVIDGINFKPNKATYSYEEASFETQKRVRFVINNEGKQEYLYIDISFPASQKNLTGEYSFGPGTADELLVMAEFYAPEKRYYIVGYSLKITDKGDSNFDFEFVSPEAYDGIKNVKVPFKGELHGKIVMEQTK